MNMEKCPFCKKEINPSFPSLMWLEENKVWSFMHHCNDNMSVLISASSKEEIEEIWNRSVKSEE